MRIAYGPLFDQAGTRKIGRFDAFSALTEPAAGSTTGFHLRESVVMFSVPGGTIAAQALVFVNQATLTLLPSTGAITGGTGGYIGASGQYGMRAEGTKRLITFQLSP